MLISSRPWQIQFTEPETTPGRERLHFRGKSGFNFEKLYSSIRACNISPGKITLGELTTSMSDPARCALSD